MIVAGSHADKFLADVRRECRALFAEDSVLGGQIAGIAETAVGNALNHHGWQVLPGPEENS